MNSEEKFEDRVVSSALWAAAGDALGWISELTDLRGLRRRTRGKNLSRPVEWRRKIGGMSGPEVILPAGTYSDDTQLRLAVCRSIRGDGLFDVETFAKVELAIWPSFALGAGRGTKAAAVNLQRRDVNWFSNFFGSSKGPAYPQAGGNGAAMRIQPHVWRHRGGGRSYLRDVVRDAIVTHGHMYGICGAVFHADCVAYALQHNCAPSPDQWREFARNFRAIEEVVQSDDQLKKFWLNAWESASAKKLGKALESAIDEMLSDIERVCSIQIEDRSTYRLVVEALDGFGERQGAGTNTALAAAYAAWLMEAEEIEVALLEVASTLGSDTDTIGTMVGAILGATTDRLPRWDIQDRDYIEYEARRLASISKHSLRDSFSYPDLARWVPPSTQSDVLGVGPDGLAIAGLGPAEILAEAGAAGSYRWLWVKLFFGQSILCKAKGLNMPSLAQSQLPDVNEDSDLDIQPSLLDVPTKQEGISRSSEQALGVMNVAQLSVDTLTDIAIRSGFDKAVMGECLLSCLESQDGLERAIAFSAITAKAYLARKRASR